ncbi:MAG: hypothetical protein AVDCRST_MAG59-585, partial [uncultured Thermomicrobiales bacterium]
GSAGGVPGGGRRLSGGQDGGSGPFDWRDDQAHRRPGQTGPGPPVARSGADRRGRRL